MNNIVELVNQYGVPIVVAVGMAYFIFYVWKFVTTNILPSLGQGLCVRSFKYIMPITCCTCTRVLSCSVLKEISVLNPV